jgi:hypothetical protein
MNKDSLLPQNDLKNSAKSLNNKGTTEESGEIQELTKKDLEIARAEVNKTEFAMSTRQKVYAWTVLMIILLCNISNQWQRFIIAVAY